MNGKLMLYVDQHGGKWYASTVKALMKIICCRHCEKMYISDREGNIYHIGYVIGGLWLTAYEPFRKQI